MLKPLIQARLETLLCFLDFLRQCAVALANHGAIAKDKPQKLAQPTGGPGHGNHQLSQGKGFLLGQASARAKLLNGDNDPEEGIGIRFRHHVLIMGIGDHAIVIIGYVSIDGNSMMKNRTNLHRSLWMMVNIDHRGVGTQPCLARQVGYQGKDGAG